MSLGWDAIVLLATGIVTFSGVFWGVLLASRRQRYARHVDRLKVDAVNVLEQWANEVEVGFSASMIAFNTLDEHNTKELEGFERRHYWDVPEVFHRPWDARSRHVVSLAAAHWPELADWDSIAEFGELTYKNTGIVHKALVHLWDGADLPRQPERLGWEMNLAPTTPGVMARATLDSALFWLTEKSLQENLSIHEEDGQWGVFGFGHVLAVLHDEKTAQTARSHAIEQLKKWHAPEAAKRIRRFGDAIEKMAERLHARTLDELYRADADGWCKACLKVVPKTKRWGLAWDSFWFVRGDSGLRHAWSAARHCYTHGHQAMPTENPETSDEGRGNGATTEAVHA